MNTLSENYIKTGTHQGKPGATIIPIHRNRIHETLGEIASGDLRTISVLKKYQLDFCCGGKKTLGDACLERGIDARTIISELEAVESLPEIRPLPCNNWSLDFLCEYIVRTHHSYVRAVLPDLKTSAKKVSEVHSGEHPELKEIYQLILLMDMEMTEHMIKEEDVVFPYIVGLVNGAPVEKEAAVASIAMMEHEHEQVGSYVHAIRTLSNNYALPSDACASYKLLYKQLEEFEDDLHMHVNLENNILFVKAEQLEKSIS